MICVLELLFWCGAFLSIYSYALYPLLLKAYAARRPLAAAPQAASQAAHQQQLSVIIAVHNGGKNIADKLEDTLRLDYPNELWEIVVASDCSTDNTDEIALGYRGRGVRLIRSSERKGKEHAQLLAIKAATSPLLVFTDVATRLAPNALRLLVSSFHDPSVGAVSSEDELTSSDGEERGEGAYVRYEMSLRRLESRCAGLVGLSGSCFAVRREICTDWRIDTPSDITVALLCAQSGSRAISNGLVKGRYQDLKDGSKEFYRKKRTIIRGMTAVWELRESLNIQKYGLFAIQVWSHKIFRWLVPAGLALSFTANLLLAGTSVFYTATLVLQGTVYVAAFLGYKIEGARRLMAIRIILYFIVANLATALAGWDFLRGVRITTWNSSERSS
jgi:glycosyltransferase involved in cell wall biosynthesis